MSTSHSGIEKERKLLWSAICRRHESTDRRVPQLLFGAHVRWVEETLMPSYPNERRTAYPGLESISAVTSRVEIADAILSRSTI